MATTRTTITIDERLLGQLESRALEQQTTVSALIEQDLRFAELQHARMSSESGSEFTLPSCDLGGVRPGVDLNDNAALLDMMENQDSSFVT
ncbi:hypothetical protein SAMN04487905_106112 [Actinopolyspora xinjiangensis]|uniref:Ribbon-helix-helix protein, copG family n=1 Tax=Actinopolyspora xinjiangensis TaxID=405564 RepID=A0A1H0U8Z4_9ACTN|nr:hypothetical protein [Actinopolyspora xinjiangensis]SDP62306.1 hypothetical protein SAMN04487905_106112 [Actinopolyspora xinjiangensis]